MEEGRRGYYGGRVKSRGGRRTGERDLRFTILRCYSLRPFEFPQGKLSSLRQAQGGQDRFAIYDFILAGVGGLGKTGKRESRLLS